LFKREKCTIQIGGSDQWGNMTAGTELIRKTERGEAHVMTLPLVTKADGTKFGKTESGTIWLDAAKTSPYAFYQFWLNTADADVENFLNYFSLQPLARIKEILAKHNAAPHERHAQGFLASELTGLVHGQQAHDAAQKITLALFDNNLAELTEENYTQLALDGLPSRTLKKEAGKFVLKGNAQTLFHDSILNDDVEKNILLALTQLGLATSNREARDFLKGKAVQVNGEVVTDEKLELTKANAKFGKYFLLKRGKKNFALLVLE